MAKKIRKTSVKSAKPAKAVEPKSVPAEVPDTPRARPRKEKQVHGRYSIPRSDYDLIAKLKANAKKNGHSVKKNELFGAGLQVLDAMTDNVLIEVLAQLKSAHRRARTAK